MARSPEGAYERIASLAVAALHERDPGRLWPLLTDALPGLCGGDAVIFKLDDWSASSGTVGLSGDSAAELARLGDEDLGLLRTGQPFASHYLAGTSREPVTARQLAGPAWPASATARLLGRTLDADHALAVPLPQPTTPITGCIVYRSGTDFTDDGILLARRAQPLLVAVDRQRQLLEQWRRLLPGAGSPDERAADCALTPRETTVLLLLADALTAAAIGRRLGISDRTVHKHVEKIYRKLGTRDRVGTVLRAQQLGLVPREGTAGSPAPTGRRRRA
ncbi:response regulator transcription factor [Streptomyces shenzhenensis]|uniref:response regulator transcription factor n=1 Tax=Streptomyces shenzhenensis TaxID=943815 RepID=UPI00217D8E2E|nr:LuxR C-terminal-related transcriptional regulator [Streptomyces shenzhenensis]